MFAVTAVAASPDDPLSVLRTGEHPDPVVPEGWVRVRVRAAGLNHHDLWTLKGVGIDPARLPIVLGCEGAGVTDDGAEVVLHTLIGDPANGGGDETLDPERSILSERYDGTLAEFVTVPARNLLPKPAAFSWEEAGCLSTAWLTAYRMVFDHAALPEGGRLLVQGAGGGVATAAIQIAAAAGYVVYVTSRDDARLERAIELGATAGVRSGGRLPERVDAVIETVGEATWDHSLKSLRPGGTVVVAGATSGANALTDLRRMFFRQLRIIGSMMGTRDDFVAMLDFMARTGVRPVIDMSVPMGEAPAGFARLHSGEAFGKVVLVG